MSGRAPFLILFCSALLALAGCGRDADGPLNVAIIGTPESVMADGLRLSEGAQTVRGAVASGLVALDAQGEIKPALADRWIVTDDGRSYIFRLREGTWPGGAELSGESARDALRRAIRQLRGTSLGLDLAPVDEIRAMAGRVVEIRLSTAMPDFLRLLAQPELALSHGGFPSGPMNLQAIGEGAEPGAAAAQLTLRPPEMRGLPQEEGWQEHVRPVRLRALDAQGALDAFAEGEVDVVLGGSVGSWPLADPGPLSRGTLRIDPAVGLFGLQVRRAGGFLARTENREALAMAIDRAALLAPFNIGGWTPTNRIVPAAIAGEGAAERWAGIELERLRGEARNRVAIWRTTLGQGEGPRLTVALADEPGLAMLFNELAGQLATVGIALDGVGADQPADLELIDRVARYAEPRWFLNQFNCALRRGMCSSDADAEVRQALSTADPQARMDAIARAEAMLTADNIYIPLAAPLRWSMVRGTVEGYAANPWAYHPLPELAVIPR
ncbi:peptide ABC transporter substrate-binding protein [Altererythrobacter soli]|uniref:Peptide ABC transporter substrate-binding protein n=1 Tax=Croceibacterium soli TaxID=1739690 RepID=A0A6I4UMD9_9SPHN|nr:ABC transporter substrate-binding protein [Croceibacterium soli]MXP40032.1 peptide ABC transporter substrate-binding protein [Croceibacterium soli]